ncbi:MAG: citrate lyase holo-[acyl-carrier protein] synthase [Oribacterium sp.]|nr:citrate lyase holo-[acyl-carrier protein] synthase [Oribacterium sp.]
MNQYIDNELDYSHEVTVPEMIAARDERVEKQQYLCKKYGKTVICFMLNIPGPHKIAPDFAAAFDLGVSRIREALADRAIDGTSDDVDQALYHSSKNDASKDNTDHRADAVPIEHTNELPVLEEHIERNVTGFILYMAVDADPIEVKKRMCVIEERDAIGRIFDIDVLRPDGAKVSREEFGMGPRKCLMCGKEAHICARARAHEVSDMVEKIHEIIKDTEICD